MTPAACTIVAKERLAHARVTAASFVRHNPGVPFYVGLADRVDGCFDPADEPFTLVELDRLGLPPDAAMPFRYESDELSYATTPFLLAHLLDSGHDRVLFFKQESLVTGDVAPAYELLGEHAILLAPHLLDPLRGEETGRELDVLLAGTYNLGFLGVADAPPARAMLAWWQQRLEAHCRHDVTHGLHFEQRWMDLVPGMFDGVRVLREPGWDVGHWSLPERRVTVTGDAVRVDGGPCRLFRFSGYDLSAPDAATRYNGRLRMADMGGAAAVFARYRELVLAAGHAEASAWPSAFARFDNGVPVPRTARDLHAALGPRAAAFGDPFATAPPGSFWRWLTGADDELGRVSRFWAHLVRSRPDVTGAYATADGGIDLRGLGGWAENTGRAEHGVPDGIPFLAAA